MKNNITVTLTPAEVDNLTHALTAELAGYIPGMDSETPSVVVRAWRRGRSTWVAESLADNPEDTVADRTALAERLDTDCMTLEKLIASKRSLASRGWKTARA